MDITSRIVFTCSQYIWLDSYLSYYSIQEYSTNIENFECMEYFCYKIIHVINFENMYIYTWKLGLWVEFVGECFCGEWYW
jgi:hypothetical protein